MKLCEKKNLKGQHYFFSHEGNGVKLINIMNSKDFFFFFLLFRAAGVAYGNSQARG